MMRETGYGEFWDKRFWRVGKTSPLGVRKRIPLDCIFVVGLWPEINNTWRYAPRGHKPKILSRRQLAAFLGVKEAMIQEWQQCLAERKAQNRFAQRTSNANKPDRKPTSRQPSPSALTDWIAQYGPQLPKRKRLEKPKAARKGGSASVYTVRSGQARKPGGRRTP